MAQKAFSVSISYPPLNSTKGSAFLSQNRQFQWTHTGNIIYPVIPASAATLLYKKGYKVFWDDAIAEKLNYHQWLSRLISRQPDLITVETKTPVIKKHWQIVKDIKKSLPKSKIILMGDHVTALPCESLKNCPVDYILTGGDYDFMLLNLANYLTKKTKLAPGFWYQSACHPELVSGSQRTKRSTLGFRIKPGMTIRSTGKFTLKHNLNTLPLINRRLTCWQLYSHHNSNFKYRPGAYTMFGRDCWWGRCTFCSWTTLFPGKCYRRLSVKRAIAEIEKLVSLGVREVFDDSGTFPVGDWLRDFCHQIITKKINKKIHLGCNMRFGALNQKDYCLMGQAGFRLILYGLESANSKTLVKINKNTPNRNIEKELSWAKKAGLKPHLTAIIGYPWESLADAQKTITLTRNLFKTGLADSIQATMLVPYPGTPLFSSSKKNNLLLTQDWNKYDMGQPVIKSPISAKTQEKLIRQLFKGVFTSRFLLRQIISIHSLNDLTHLANYAVKFLKKLKDFS